MKPLTYNSPERAKERAEVVPLTDKELNSLVFTLHQNLILPNNRLLAQRLIDHYENLRHLSENIGGWQGLNALQVNYEIVKH